MRVLNPAAFGPEQTFTPQTRYASDVDSQEAVNVLSSVMAQFRAKAWTDLKLLVEEGLRVKNTHYDEIKALSGRVYQVRVNVYWDDKWRKHLRVCGAIDDGG